MKKILFLVIVLGLLLSACGLTRKTTDDECSRTWLAFSGDLDLPTSSLVDFIWNTEPLPNTVGEYLHWCLEEEWRPIGL